jgi:hypothetical protein
LAVEKVMALWGACGRLLQGSLARFSIWVVLVAGILLIWFAFMFAEP